MIFARCTGSGSSRIISSNIFNKYTFKEIISDDFLFNFYPKAVHFCAVSVINLFRNFDYLQYTKEETNYIFNKIVDAFISEFERDRYMSDRGSSTITLLKKIADKNIDQSEFMKILFEKDFFKKVRFENAFIVELIDNIISTGKFDNAVDMIKTIQNQYPEYRNFPLIVMNKNISTEEKTKALKLVYRQKDFPQYKHFFRSNLSDFNDFDSFVEATIIQNNRVKEKDANLIKLFKDVFVHGDGTNIYRRNILHKNEFSTKYIKYFMDPKFVNKFYVETVSAMSTNTWKREEQYQNFIRIIFSSADALTKIEALQQCKELESLGKNFNEDFSVAWEEGDDEISKALIKVFLKWSEIDSTRFFKEMANAGVDAVQVIKKYSDSGIFDDYFKNLKFIDYHSDRNCTYFKFERQDQIAVLFEKNVFDKVAFLSEENMNCIGFNYEDIIHRINMKSDWGGQRFNQYNIITEAQAGMLQLLNIIYTICEAAQSKNKLSDIEKIINKFFVRFENPDVVSSYTENVMNIHSDNKIKSISRYGSYYNTIDLVKEIRDELLKTIKKIYGFMAASDESYNERLETILANFEESQDILDLVCYVQ